MFLKDKIIKNKGKSSAETENSMNKQNHQLRFTMVTVLLLLSFLLPPLISTAADQNLLYNPTDHILLDCGSSSKSSLSDSDGRNWTGDVGTKFSPEVNNPNISFPATAAEQDSFLSQRVPYMTARIILSQFSYAFPVTSGQKILRLYFYPANYSANRYMNQSFFAVTVNNYILLSNFSAFLAVSAQNPQAPSLVKEFIINVQETQVLNVTFLPSANSYAFVNGIEVVSSPKNLYMGDHNHVLHLQLVSTQNTLYPFDENNTAFETLYRLNVGGRAVSVMEDTGMYRQWSQDDPFIWGGDVGNPLTNNTIAITYTSQTPNFSAPAIVYSTARAMGSMSLRYNLTWNFSVDSGFYYLLRLHFCEFTPFLVNDTNQRVFNIFINNRTAEQAVDVIQRTGGTGIPIFRDFVVLVSNPSPGKQSKQDLFLALHPDVETSPMYYDAILNGLEIFKLNSTDGNLAGTNPELNVDPNSSLPNLKPSEDGKGRGRLGMILAVIGGVSGVGAIILILSFLIIRRRGKGAKDFDRKSASKSSWGPLSTTSRSTKTSASGGSASLPSDLCRRFLLDEIKSATDNFNPNFVIGTGGFGNVYRGYIDNNLIAVAIKRLNPSSRQGAHEFRTEIEMLSNLRHVHLVSLIGYCDEKGEMILVYDYMANGTLRDHLYRPENLPLAWKQRLQVCIGASRGLHYLHSGAKQSIIHRDVKSTNILLDEKWVAKVSDFGLSKLGPTGGIHSHVSTQVKGSFGYVDPEYYKRQQLTDKSDVYSFGVVLFEVLCARPAVIPSLPREQVNLAEWARRCYRKGTVDQIVDPNIKGQIAPECLRSYSEIAIKCLKDQGIERPAMSDVVGNLEFALQLQEAADKEGDLRPIFLPLILHARGKEEGNTSTGEDTVALFTSSGEENIAAADALKNQSGTTSTGSSEKLKSDGVFSEIMNPTGR